MAKPVILTLDDDVAVLNAVERDLRVHYGKDYRVVKATSPAAALDTLRELKKRNDQVGLLLVDQRMPEMEGTVFLAQATRLYPEARKVLLTAYADTEAAIAAINEIGLDHYLMKLWSPPEQHLYPVLDDLLDDWRANVDLAYDGIRVAGTLWSATSHQVKEFLARSQIPYQWLDIERDEEARVLVESTIDGQQGRLPVVFFPDGTTLVDPDLATLAAKVGLHTEPSQPFYDLIIVGAGPAGLAGAVYGASKGLHTLLVDKETTGGQAGTSSRIENYLGFPKGLSGADLARRATVQATRLGAEILTAREVTGVRADDPYRFVELADGTELSCKALMIATGVSVRTLEVPGIEELTGAGVYYGAAMSEAAAYQGEEVFVVGGANSAGQAAMLFSRYAGRVTMLVRGNSLNEAMSRYLVDQIDSTQNIEVRSRATVAEVRGENRLQELVIEDTVTGSLEAVPAAALFVLIGAKPHTGFVSDVVECDEAGFILTGPDLSRHGRRPRNWPLKRDPYLLETSVPGILAVGDVRQGVVRRVASAVGQGASAISFVHQYLKTV